MKNNTQVLEELTLTLKKELNNPKTSSVKRTYIAEKLKMLGAIIISKKK